MRRQRADCRDWTDAAARPPDHARVVLPVPPALDQGTIAACAVNACANAYRFCMERGGVSGFRPSRAFVHYNAKVLVMRQAPGGDSGTNMRDVCKAVSRFGACREERWPYRARLMWRKPNPDLYDEARRMPRCQYVAVPQTLCGITSCLAAGYPVLMGVSVHEGGMEAAEEGGVLHLPSPGIVERDKHAILVCGYDLTTETFLAQNSWGPAWGRVGGFFDLPFAYALDAKLCWDLWALKLRRPPEPPPHPHPPPLHPDPPLPAGDDDVA